MQYRASRVRICCLLTAVGIAGAGFGCGEVSTPAGPSPSAAGTAAEHTTGGSAAGGAHHVGPELAAVRQATARFHDISAAFAAGYTIPPNEPCVAIPLGGMGVHAPNPALMEQDEIDPLRPELLLYLPKANGGYKLIGVEYFQVVKLRNLTTGAIVDKWLSQDPWDPAEYAMMTPTPQLFGQTFQGPMPGHTPAMGWHWDLHAWVWAPNPSGMFAEWNPKIQCP